MSAQLPPSKAQLSNTVGFATPPTVNPNTLAPEIMHKLPIQAVSSLKKAANAFVQNKKRKASGGIMDLRGGGGFDFDYHDTISKRTVQYVKKMSQLCSFLPDCIVMDEINRKIPYQFSFEAVVLMADISGFTALTETYSLRGKGGTDQLTKTLAGYIGPLAECILLAEGDIVKYAGDAFIAYWRSEEKDYPEDIQRVVDCALYIQEKYGSYLCKDVDVTIRVKIGIGLGTVHFGGIGTEAYQHWVLFGPGVKAASEAEKHCSSGDVVLHPSSWAFCTPWHFHYSIKDQPFVHIIDIINYISHFKRGRPRSFNFAKASIGYKKQSINMRSSTSTSQGETERIRPQTQLAADRKPEAVLRPFMIPPVLRKLDDDIPVEYLNESRVVCICFIHVKYDDKVDADEKNFRDNVASIVQRAFVKIYQNVTKFQGALSKVIMFDKGLTYLVAMGLPGYINENQSAHALKFSYKTRLALKAIKFVTDVSIGVTTGSCYCGIIGHPRRQEYTVIGRKVNKAARLMVHYPDTLTCDQDTAYFSKLPSDNFKLMEARELKGIKDVGKIYEFVDADSIDDNSIPFFQYPMLGRESELSYFKGALVRAQKDLEQFSRTHTTAGSMYNKGLGNDPSGNQKPIWMIIFEGDNGIGKSRLLSGCIQEAEKMNIRVSSVVMNLASSSQASFAISCLVIDALGMIELRTVQEREDYLRKHVTDPDLATDLCLINEILFTKFPLNPKYASLDVNSCHTYGQHVLYNLLKATYRNELILFVVDDSHLMDFRSWEYLIYISKFPNMFILCSLRRSSAGSPKLSDNVAKQIYHNKHIKIIRMTGIEENLLLPLACQMMQVKSIPTDLVQLLKNKSNGVPAWVSQVLNELLRTGIIRLHEDTPLSKIKQHMSNAENKYLAKVTQNSKKSFRRWVLEDDDVDKTSKAGKTQVRSVVALAATSTKEQSINPLDRVLVIKSDTNIQSVPVSGTLKEILLDAFDELSPNEQIILKAASVLGVRFSRKMLTKLLPSYETSTRRYDQCFIQLFDAKYFRCASGTTKQKEGVSAINVKPDCFCKNDLQMSETEEDVKVIDRRPKYYSCRFMEFIKENMVEVVYDLMTEDQRMECHLKAAKYLDSSSVLCESCGGEERSYAYGFVKKAHEFSMETEDALRITAEQTRGRRKSIIAERESIRRLSNVSYKNGDRNRRTLVTQLESVKKTFNASGTKLGQLQLDILKNLVEFDREDYQPTCREIFCCSSRKTMLEHDFLEQQGTIQDFEHSVEQDLRSEMEVESNLIDTNKLVHFKSGDATANRKSSYKDSDPTGNFRRSSDSARRSTYYMIDLRTCQCAILQAKICVEMVFHYREAKKYGRCLQNLLDAAESDVTVGNGTQALVHVEDAIGLLNQVKRGNLPKPDKNDQDDTIIDEKEAEAQVEFLSGLAYFEIGVNGKARDYFLKALHRLGLVINYDQHGVTRDTAIIKAKLKLCRVRKCGCCYNAATHASKKLSRGEKCVDDAWQKKIRILTYLHNLFKQERKIEMAWLVTIWQVILAEQDGDIMREIIPAYANMMDIYGALSDFKQAIQYEKRSLDLIHTTLGTAGGVEPVALITSGNLFLTIAVSRLNRGEIESSSKAAYLALSIAQSINDNSLIIRILSLICHSLLLSLRISELAEVLQKLWFLSEEADDWTGVSSYYGICLDLLLNTAYPLEQFGVCENFIVNSDWTAETSMYRDFETQYSMEASLALWYARYSRWDQSMAWHKEAESHRPKNHSFIVVNADLKLFESQLIHVNHFLDSKIYQSFAKAKGVAKEMMRNLTGSTKVVPVLIPRFNHLMGYYFRIRSRSGESERQLKLAEKLAVKMGNHLEIEFITHSRNVWADMVIPSIKFFWLEHTENHTLDWHSSGRIPWANIMYSLPVPSWK